MRVATDEKPAEKKELTLATGGIFSPMVQYWRSLLAPAEVPIVSSTNRRRLAATVPRHASISCAAFHKSAPPLLIDHNAEFMADGTCRSG